VMLISFVLVAVAGILYLVLVGGGLPALFANATNASIDTWLEPSPQPVVLYFGVNGTECTVYWLNMTSQRIVAHIDCPAKAEFITGWVEKITVTNITTNGSVLVNIFNFTQTTSSSITDMLFVMASPELFECSGYNCGYQVPFSSTGPVYVGCKQTSSGTYCYLYSYNSLLGKIEQETSGNGYIYETSQTLTNITLYIYVVLGKLYDPEPRVAIGPVGLQNKYLLWVTISPDEDANSLILNATIDIAQPVVDWITVEPFLVGKSEGTVVSTTGVQKVFSIVTQTVTTTVTDTTTTTTTVTSTKTVTKNPTPLESMASMIGASIGILVAGGVLATVAMLLGRIIRTD